MEEEEKSGKTSAEAHLDEEQLQSMTLAQLKDLAAEMEVSTTGLKYKADYVAAIAAVSIEPGEEIEPEEPEETPAPEPLMYVGPTIAGFGIQNRVYTEIPAEAQEEIAKTPELRNLFLQIRQYPKAERQIREEKGYIYSAYLKALDIKK